jgi:hypothetical protein
VKILITYLMGEKYKYKYGTNLVYVSALTKEEVK